jgi:Mg-chelatase subunit ChlD
MVIICTDGLANLGLGSMENDGKKFYEDLGTFAQECGVVISVVTIKGEGCKIDILGQLAEKTNGTVTRVKPEDIGTDFANILKDELVGT